MSGEENTNPVPLVRHSCPDCGYTARKACELTRHLVVHSGERAFACHTCDSRFTQKSSLKTHIRQVHLKADEVKCTWSGCDKSFGNLVSMQAHLEAVHLKTRFACPVAGCRFTSGWKDAIKRHVRAVHKKVKPFACSVAGCRYRSAYHSRLAHHRQSVHEGRRVACSFDGCDFRTAWPEELKRHVESVHEKIVRFACHVCGKRIYKKADLRRHLQSHEKQGHPVTECASCQDSLLKEIKRSTVTSQKEQSSSSSGGVSDLLTSVPLDMRLLSLSEH